MSNNALSVNTYTKGRKTAILVKSNLKIDADGSPRAYAPNSKKYRPLDYLANAGHEGNWWGIVTENGKPVQQTNGKYKGYYISTTALANPNYKVKNTKRYVDSEKIPYIVNSNLFNSKDVELGDICYVRYKNKGSYAIVADVGPEGEFGEGSIRLVKNLGLAISYSGAGKIKGGGMDKKKIKYIIFKNSKKKTKGSYTKTTKEINQIGKRWMKKFNKRKLLKKCK